MSPTYFNYMIFLEINEFIINIDFRHISIYTILDETYTYGFLFLKIKEEGKVKIKKARR